MSQGEMRRLADGPQAARARQDAEKHLRDVVHTYDKDTGLTLAMVTVDDSCGTGAESVWPSEDDRYRIRCTLAVAGYYGADPDRIGDELNGIFSAGDRHTSGTAPDGSIPFGHDDYRTKLVAYYRGKGPNPVGPATQEPRLVSDPSQTLEWDAVRSRGHRSLIEEPPACAKSDPPVRRCFHEPEPRAVADIRRRYGMVFRLTESHVQYYEVYKDGRTYTHG
ncbi:hypothetical protein ACFVXE_17895 [Streptomyces sp. NPDC058231]|uniref:hypothetical protein n=1 Tax=Streptomyces sp. NPDC058231 TaxID=3346392 RepID=UPI0036E793F0